MKRIEVTPHEGYYLIQFLEGSREAVDDWLAAVESLMADCTPSDYRAYLIQVPPDKPPPLGYVMQAAGRSVRQHRQRPTTRTAVLYREQDTFLLAVLDTFLRWLTVNSNDAVRFFPYAQQQEAVCWLRRET